MVEKIMLSGVTLNAILDAMQQKFFWGRMNYRAGNLFPLFF